VTVAIDLRGDWTGPLEDAGLRAGEPAAWLAEGLLTYLSTSEAVDLLTRIGRLSAAGSRLAFALDELGSEVMRARAHAAPETQEHAGLWKGGLPDAPAWLVQHGWQATLHSRVHVAEQYGRPEVGASAGSFVIATRSDRPDVR
jgi:methyltransferase (TIGR00027 family)